MSTNPIQYTSRTFTTILADLNSDPSLVDKPDWWKRIWAGIGDILSIWENASANGNFLRTAFTRRQVADICQLIGYQLSPAAAAQGNILFDFSSSTPFPLTLQLSDIAAVTQDARRYEGLVSYIASALSDTIASGSWTGGQVVFPTPATIYVTGERVRLSTTGTLPTGLATNTDYYVIVSSQVSGGNVTLKLASSRANAYAGTSISFSTSGTGNHTITRYSRSINVRQQTTVQSTALASGDGVTPFLVVQIPQVNVLPDSIVVTINGVTWTNLYQSGNSFVNSGTTSTHYRLSYNADNSCYIEFGDGVYGAIPGSFPISVQYAYGGGSGSNVGLPDVINAYAGTSAYVIDASNPTSISGGSDPESIAHAKNYAPMLLRASDRFITVEDGQALLLAYGGFSQVAVIANGYGLLTAQIVAVATGGGSPALALRSAAGAYLAAKSIFDSIAVYFDAGIFTPQGLTVSLHVLAGYSSASVAKYATTAMQLFLADVGLEIYNAFLGTGGVAAAVTLINSYSQFGFPGYGVGDYAAVTQMLNMFAIVAPRAFGDTLQLSDFYAFVQGGVAGIDYLNLTASTYPFPWALSTTQISQAGTVTVNVV